jgi:Calcineurin-like phosphoesterase superfamily domain
LRLNSFGARRVHINLLNKNDTLPDINEPPSSDDVVWRSNELSESEDPEVVMTAQRDGANAYRSAHQTQQGLKIAIISDIHGNLTALDSVLPAIKDADRVICSGDVAAVGPQPHETVVFLRKKKWPYVMGNADETLASSTPEDYCRPEMPTEERKRMVALDSWTAAELENSDKKFLAGFKPTLESKRLTIRSYATSLASVEHRGHPSDHTRRQIAQDACRQVS